MSYTPGPPGQPPQHGGYPPQQAYPPHHGHPPQPGYPPSPGYGHSPPGPAHHVGQPRKSKAGLFIGLGIGTVALLGLLFHFIFVDNAWMDGTPKYDEPGSIATSTSPGYANSGSTVVDQAFIRGRWCDDAQGTFTFTPMGTSPTAGNVWTSKGGRNSSERYELAAGSIGIWGSASTDYLPIARVDANTMTITPTGRAPETLRRC